MPVVITCKPILWDFKTTYHSTTTSHYIEQFIKSIWLTGWQITKENSISSFHTQSAHELFHWIGCEKVILLVHINIAVSLPWVEYNKILFYLSVGQVWSQRSSELINNARTGIRYDKNVYRHKWTYKFSQNFQIITLLTNRINRGPYVDTLLKLGFYNVG